MNKSGALRRQRPEDRILSGAPMFSMSLVIYLTIQSSDLPGKDPDHLSDRGYQLADTSQHPRIRKPDIVV